MKRRLLTAALIVLAASACGSGNVTNTDPDTNSACLVGTTDCADDPTPHTDPDTNSACLVGTTDCADDPTAEYPVEDARQRAHGVLGVAEHELPDDVRIGRIGDEQRPLTEDYQLGRLTVALDDLDGSGLRVVEVTVELPAGPETYELEPS